MEMKEKKILFADKTEFIVEKIIKGNKLTIEDLVNGKVKRRSLQSLLLKAFENIVSSIKEESLLEQYEINRFVQSSDLDQRELLNFDRVIYSILPDEFRAVELSIVNPLGINSILTNINQKTVLSTIRNIEVIGDVTTALALECARKRKQILHHKPEEINKEVNLCSSQRVIRLQRFDKIPGFTSHFKVFGACTAGRKSGSLFGIKSLIRHVSIYLDLLKALKENGYFIQNIIVSISDIRIIETLVKQCNINREILRRNTQIKSFDMMEKFNINLPRTVSQLENIPAESIEYYKLKKSINSLKEIKEKALRQLKNKYPDVKFRFDLARIAGIGYYENLCFKITAENKQKQEFPVSDGGLVDWNQRLLKDNREQLFISGFGSELFCRNFKI